MLKPTLCIVDICLVLLFQCHSPVIISFYGAFFLENRISICTEFMDGKWFFLTNTLSSFVLAAVLNFAFSWFHCNYTLSSLSLHCQLLELTTNQSKLEFVFQGFETLFGLFMCLFSLCFEEEILIKMNIWKISYYILCHDLVICCVTISGGSLDQYKKIPECILGPISVSVVRGLQYLWSLRIMHRGTSSLLQHAR